MARDGTLSPAVGGNCFGSHCRGNGIPRSLFSAPVGTGINGSYASDAGWERNGNCYMRGMGMGNDGVYTEWEREREWEFEQERERQWEFERNGNGNGDLNGNGNGNGNLNGNEDANRRDKCGMGAKIQKSGACYMGLMALARERYRSAHQCITMGRLKAGTHAGTRRPLLGRKGRRQHYALHSYKGHASIFVGDIPYLYICIFSRKTRSYDMRARNV